MAYHLSNLGLFSRQVSRYADQAGYVPEAGDPKPSEGGWDDMTDDDWSDHVAAAVAATAEAEADITAWRNNG